MLKRFSLLFLATLGLAACGPTAQQAADEDAVGRSGVSPAIYDKMVHDDPLGLSDIVALTHARVNDGILIRYIRDHGTVYTLTPPDFDYLRGNGVSPSVVDYMAQTGGGGPYPGGPVILPPPIAIGIGIGGGGRFR